MLELARTVVELTGSSSTIDFVPLPEDDPQVRRPDLTRAQRLLDWRPTTPVREGLSRTIEWAADQLGSRRSDRLPA